VHVDGVLACDDVIDARSLLVALLGHDGTLTKDTHTRAELKKNRMPSGEKGKKIARPLILS